MSAQLSRHARVLLAATTRNHRTTLIKTQTRNLGAGQPESQSSKARLWEGHKTAREDWETTVYATYAAATVILTLALGFTPDTSTETVRYFSFGRVLCYFDSDRSS